MKTVLTGFPAQMAASAPAGGVYVIDTGGFFTGTTVEEILAEIGGGTLGGYLTVIGGGKGTVQALGTLGATETIDLANGNAFTGTLDQACAISTTGWTNLKDCQIRLELLQDGTGGWLPTISGVTWVTDAPIAGAAGTVQHIILISSDGGTTIWGWVAGDAATAAALAALLERTVGYQAHGNMGATETFDAAVGWHSATFDANCTFTLTAVATDTSSLFLELAQSTGGHTLTLPASVVNKAALEAAQVTTAGETTFLVLLSRNAGTTWIGGWWGGAAVSALTISEEGTPLTAAATSIDVVGAGATATAVGDAVTITIPGTPTGAAGGDLAGTYPNPTVVDDSHSHTGATLPATHFEPVQFDDGSAEWPFVYFGGEIVMAEVPN